MQPKYDYLVVGSGLTGSVFAQKMTASGKSVLVIEKRKHVGGNCYTEYINGIQVHRYGAHIFHTSNEVVWNYIRNFAAFNNFVNRPKVFYRDRLYSFPVNMMTFYQLWGTITPEQAKIKLKSSVINNCAPKNMEEWALANVGREIYEIFIKGYTLKQWNKHPRELPSDILKRVPVRFTFDDNYFEDNYQGIPIGGYTKMIDRMLDGIQIVLNTDYLQNKEDWDTVAEKVFYTGRLDEFFGYKHGRLEYRGLKFEDSLLNGDFQGNAVVNYTDERIPYTRIIEHKHFEKNETESTFITREVPCDCKEADIPYYPVLTEKNVVILNRYLQEISLMPKYIIGGRLGMFKYFDMDDAIAAALAVAEKHRCS